jgi:hypothetical protein
LIVNHQGYACPQFGYSNVVTITPSIKVDLVGNEIDTVCHGGSVEKVFALSNFRPVNNNDRIYYRIYENNLYFEAIEEIYTLPIGLTEIKFTTHPSLHNNENGPQSYCYTVEVWQGTTLPGGVPNPFAPDECHTFSACHYVMVLKDPVATLSGPSKVCRYLEPPTFRANVVGGIGDIAYEWFLDGLLVPTATVPEYTLDDVAVLETLGSHDIAVKTSRTYSGCEASLVVHNFEIIRCALAVEIVGPTEGCVGQSITLTALVDVDEIADYTLQWYQDGQIIIGATGHQYSFIVDGEIDLTNFTVEVIMDGCNQLFIVSPVHYFQVVPPTVVVVDNYVICENGNVDVTATAVVYGDNEIYRYIWYNANLDTIDITYVNHKLFNYADITFDNGVATFSVSAEMLNGACASALAEFTITEIPIPILNPDYEPIDTAICPGTQLLFIADYLSTDPNLVYTWYINHFPVEGLTDDELYHIFDQPGEYIIEVSATTLGGGCISTIDPIATVHVYATPTVSIEGPTVVCDASEPTVLYAVVDPLNAGVTYQWYEYYNGVEFLGGTTSTQVVNANASPYPYIYVVEITDT